MQASDIQDSYPLTPLQEGMLFNHEIAPGSGLDIVQIVCMLHERIDPGVLEEAWQSVVRRIPVLRTSYHWDGDGAPVQRVRLVPPAPAVQTDWTGVDSAECEKRFNAYLESDRRAGFDPETPPLIRLAAFTMGGTGTRLLVTLHHLLLDGHAFPLLLGDLLSECERSEGGTPAAPGEQVPFSTYIGWLRGRDHDGSGKFWKEYLRGFTQPTAFLPESGAPGPQGEFIAFDRRDMTLPEPVLNGLRVTAKAAGVNLSTIFHTAWGILLGRYSGTTDVLFGETRACRKGTVEGAGTILGCCINTVPLRIRIQPGALLTDLLTQVHDDRVAVRTYEQTPPGKIRGWSEVTGGRPLFDSLLVYDHVGLTSLMRARHPSHPEREYSVFSHTHFPLVFEVQGDEGVLRLTWSASQFSPDSAERMLSHLRTILTGMSGGGAQPVSDIRMLTEDEERRILIEWNDTRAAGETRPRCVHELIGVQAELTPEGVAVSCGTEKLTYRELNQRADELARRLAALGVGPEVVVGIALERSCEMVVCLLAILKSGGAYLPLDPSLPGERLRFILDDADPSFVVTSRPLAGLFRTSGAALVFPDGTPPRNVEGPHKPPARPGPGNAAYVIYTSGSTGRPKGTVVLHRGLTNYLLWCTEAYDVKSGSGSLVHTPLAFDLTVTGLYAPLLCGRTVHLVPESSTPEDLPRALLDHPGCSIVKITPAHVDLLASLMSPGAGDSLTARFVIGGESLRWDVAARMQSIAPGAVLFNEYGPTETTVGCSSYRIPQGVRKSGPVPVGRPINNTRIYILDPEMRPLPVGVRGEIWIGGAGVAREYLNRVELSAERFVRDPFSADEDSRLYRSGDLGRYLPDGNIEFLGRTDDQVKIRGYRIEPGEIVSVILSHGGIRDAAVIPRAVSAGETRLEAYFVPAAEPSPGGDELRVHLRNSLPDYMVPSVFVRVSSLPLNARGKVDRGALLDRGIARVHEPGAEDALLTPAEDAMARIWEDLLAVKGIAPADNFFDIGGHSLAAMQLVSRIHARWNVDVRISDVFNAPTLAALASAVEHRVLEEVERMPDEGLRPPRNADLFTAGEQSNA